MITDPTVASTLRSEWDGVVKMRERMKLLVVATFAGGAITGRALANVLYNLPVLLAFDVLTQALAAMRDQGAFACSRNQLGHLMDGSKTAVPWIDWDKLRAGVRRRNEIAHDGTLFDGSVCLQDVASVSDQFRNVTSCPR